VSCPKQPVIRGHSLVLSFFIFDILAKISWTRRPILAPVVKFWCTAYRVPVAKPSDGPETLEQNLRQIKILPAAALTAKLTSG
jgi:hypothetical protein